MRCHQCSYENALEVRFCGGCGAPTAGDRTGTEGEGAPSLVLRPSFVPQAALLSALPLQIFLTVWGAGFFGGFSQLLIDGFDLTIPRWVPFAMFGSVFFVGVSLFFYRAQQRSYEKTEYRFTRYKLDYQEGFLTVADKTVSLASVGEVSLRRSLVQQRYDLGTIHLSSPTTLAGTQEVVGIQIHDVENPEAVCQQIQQLVDAAQRGSALGAGVAA